MFSRTTILLTPSFRCLLSQTTTVRLFASQRLINNLVTDIHIYNNPLGRIMTEPAHNASFSTAAPHNKPQLENISPERREINTKALSDNKLEEETKEEEIAKPPATYKDKLKQAMAQYGSTVIVFHVTISLASLGTCYALVKSGLDISGFLETLGLSESSVNKLASSSGTFAAAYLIHKVFAPVRISMTLTCTPFIVRYLRRAGFIKKALPKEKK